MFIGNTVMEWHAGADDSVRPPENQTNIVRADRVVRPYNGSAVPRRISGRVRIVTPQSVTAQNFPPQPKVARKLVAATGHFRYHNAIKRKGANAMMTFYLGLTVLGAALMAALITGVCLLCR